MPNWNHIVREHLAVLRLPPKREIEIVEELALHLEAVYEDALDAGLSEAEAEARAAQSYDWWLLECELSRAERPLAARALQPSSELIERKGGMRMESLLQDLRFGARMLMKNTVFTLVAVFTLALGIGANTAIFSVVNAVLLRPLPFKEPERLVMVWNRGAEAAGGDRTPLAVADLLDWRAQSKSFAEIGALQNTMFSYTGGDSSERIQAAGVTANFFSMLGAQAQLGRTFSPDEERPGAQRVALLSDGFWRKHFAADPQVVGRTINLNGVGFTVIGVMPAALDFPSKWVELWTALQLQQPTRRGPYFLRGVARLKPGVGLEQARAEALNALKSSFEGELDLNVMPVNEFIVGDVRLALLVLLGAVTLVLLIAAVNVANLMLSRSAARVKEISIRAALGASRARIIRQLLTESLVLALAGGLLGAMWASWGVELVLKLAPENIPRLSQIGIDGRALGWTALVSLLAGVLFGLAPAWQSSRLGVNETLKEGGRGATESLGKRRWRNLLVVSELALAVMLLIGAGLLVKSFWRLQRVDSGVDTERILTMQLALRGPRYADPRQVDAFYPRLLEKVQALPGVRAVAASNSLPPDNTEFSDDFTIEGRPTLPNQTPPIAYLIRVSPDYFRAFSVPLRLGRYFNAADSADAPLVTIISETMARRFFQNEDPIGKRINTNDVGEPTWWRIVGVVGDVKYTGLADETQPAMYQPLIQATSWNVFLSVKTESADPLSLAAAVRGEIKTLDRELPVARVRTLDQHFASAVAQPRFGAALVVLFAAIALILASVGVYGVISYSVTQRAHEIGVRIALGARSRDVLTLVVKQGMTLTAIGLGLGLSASFGLTRLMKTLLFGVSETDPSTFMAISLLLTAVALLACLVPARRAAKVDPMVAMRQE